ncbi:alpha-2-macroglobulin family protein [Alphaproteobacteria bacterium KMM 3653]|uniref:Alpha-2-macroglobulin family protein n=1 Tax=Harenicola maris TaxID=2841044 RepID=A0AAP2CS26_9RHOB|nr:alpha-2-macroglobulin family protein [Harenicola maris]
MRALAMALILALPGTGLTLQTAQAQGSGPVPEARLLPEKNVDFYGSDLTAIFDTTYDACTAACMANAQCGAFTFNSRSNSCFPKSEVTERSEYEGALSAVVLRTDPAVLALAGRRAADLGFVGARDLREARSFALDLGRRHPPKTWTMEQLEAGLAKAEAENRHKDVLLWAGPAIVLTDRPDLWAAYARGAGAANGSNASERRDLAKRGVNAGINAYLRAQFPQDQVAALEALATSLERSNRGKSMLQALRLANDILPNDQLTQRMNSAAEKYGFRITDHEVQADSADPRICATFSEPLVKAGIDYAPYVQMPGVSFAVDHSGRQLCLSGVEHGGRYQATFRAGLPAANGEVLLSDVNLSLYVRDRAPAVSFPGRGYVLPKAGDPALPITSVNLSEVDLTLYRVSDRNLLRTFQQNYFGRPLSQWEQEGFARDVAEQVWEGTGQLETRLNEDVTTRLPMKEAIGDLPAGIYTLQARLRGADPYEDPTASQWFVISDIGLTSMSGADGLHVFARSLGSAEAIAGAEVTLLSRANRVLGTAVTDEKGYARFAPGLSLGHEGAAPALVTVTTGAEDMAFLSLTDPEFDLSDRGVEGRAPAGPIDLFLTTDRGAYRTGEVIFATALTRDADASAISGLPLTAVLTRPDGVEYARYPSTNAEAAGGHAFAMPINGAAPRGTWTLAIYADTKAPALTTQSVLVEDFLPERIDFDLAMGEGPLVAGGAAEVTVDARYLFGAPGSDLPIEGEVRAVPVKTLPDYPGFRFGRHDDSTQAETNFLSGEVTDADGKARLGINFPALEGATGPAEARIAIRVSEGSGRPVERRLTELLRPSGPVIGIKPLFEDVAAEGTDAGFTLISVGADGAAEPMQVRWTLNRLRTRYQWYAQHGNWNWEATTTRTRVASGETRIDDPVEVSGRVDWGNYELVVERMDGAYTASSVKLWAGWYAPAEASSTPDTLELSLDKPAYRSGETARLRLVPRYAGKAVVTVVSNRLIDFQTVEVTEGENLIDLDVTDGWGAGAYVTASVIRPMDAPAGRNPARALGLSYAAVDPGAKQLTARFDVPDTARPRAPLEAVLRVEGAAAGETVYATIAAVDQGILNITGFEPPDPSGHYFGQRKLGMGLRDVYGRLIDGLNGAEGTVRSGGGNAETNRQTNPPPTEELVAYFSGPLTVGPDGTARTTFDMPSFNGSVRLMGVVWSDSAVGQADAEVLVRDPVVLTATLPRFMAPGDRGQMLLELVHAEGPAGDVEVSLVAEGLALDTADLPAAVRLETGGKATLRVPVTAQLPGLYTVGVMLRTPDGKLLRKALTLPVQINDPEVTRTSRFALAAGDTFTFSRDVFEGMQPGSGKATLAMGPLARFDAPGLLATLDRYPYGCTEQTTSRALPLLYFEQVAEAMGLEQRDQIRARVEEGIERVLARQAPSGGFGLWRAVDGDFWLDAYVTDFLSRAKAQGFDVPETAFRSALDNLRNRVNYAPDFDHGGQNLAYALMVLAREGAASMSDLRYYADVKARDFATPLASAQIASALAFYGDQQRADKMFLVAAQQMIGEVPEKDAPVWRADYGTNRRDAAAVLALAAEAGTQVIDQDALAVRVTGSSRRMSTQEAVWSLMAASALIDAAPQTGITVDGVPLSGPMVQVLEDQAGAADLLVRNGSGREATVTLTTFGVPQVPEPAGGNGYAIKREYFSMEGEPVNPSGAVTGDRMVTVLTVTPFAEGEARLMVDDPLPAGFEIDNPNLLRAGDISALEWLKPATAQHSEFRQERFLAAVDWRKKEPFRLAYIVRAISPGDYHHPAASVEDMYRPHFRAHTDAGRVTVN